MGRLNMTRFLFQINGQILYGRSHQNASTIINNAPSKVKIILIRQDVQSLHSRQKNGGATGRYLGCDIRTYFFNLPSEIKQLVVKRHRGPEQSATDPNRFLHNPPTSSTSSCLRFLLIFCEGFLFCLVHFDDFFIPSLRIMQVSASVWPKMSPRKGW